MKVKVTSHSTDISTSILLYIGVQPPEILIILAEFANTVKTPGFI